MLMVIGGLNDGWKEAAKTQTDGYIERETHRPIERDRDINRQTEVESLMET